MAPDLDADLADRERDRGLRLGGLDPDLLGLVVVEQAIGDRRAEALERLVGALLRDERQKTARAAVTLADVQRVARTWLVPANRTTGIYLASSTVPQRAPLPTRVDVAQLLANFTGQMAAAPIEDFELTAANIESRLVKSRLTVGGQPGLQLVVLPRQTKGERVTGTLRLRWGTAETVAGSAVLAGFAGSLLVHGTAAQSAEQIKQTLLALDATVGFSTSAGGLSANFELPAKNTAAFMRLLAELLTQATLPDAEFERQRTAALANFQSTKADTAAVAGNALQQVFSNYPEADPRASLSFAQREALLRSATALQVRAFYKRFASAAIGEMALIGPVQPAQVQAQLQQLMGSWTSSEPRKPWVYAYPASLPSTWQSVQVPDKANANLQGQLLLPLSDRHPDYAALTLANYLFGRGGSSRLWVRIRETDGLSYDVRSVLAWSALDDNTQWTVTAIFAPQNQPKVEAAFREELARSLKDGFTQSELDEGRKGLLSTRRLARAQDGGIAAQLVSNLYLDRRFAFDQQVDDAMARASLADVNAAWRRHIDPQRLAMAWGGDFKLP